MAEKIKNIVLDLAGVVLNLDLERDTAALNSIGLPDFEGCLEDKEIATPLLAYLNGLMETEAFCEAMHPLCSKDATNDDILYAMDAVLDVIPRERIDLIIALRKKYKVYLLSNIYETAWNYAVGEIEKHGVSLNDCFDKVFLSYEMHLAKPDTRIFMEMIKETSINPSETIYFDDSRSNVQAGKEVGFISYLVPMNGLDEMLKKLCF